MPATAAAAVLMFLTLSCGESAPSVQEVTVRVPPEEQKSIYIDNFLNLTSNEELNIFEEGIPEMLTSSLTGLRSVRIVPRDIVYKLQAVSESPSSETDFIELARKQGARYLLDGWIQLSKEGNYRIYTNLLDLDTNKMQQKFSEVEFIDKEDALDKISTLITDIQEKLIQPQSKLETFGSQVTENFNAYRYYTKALQSYHRGQFEIAAALMEQHIKIVNDDFRKKGFEKYENVDKAPLNAHLLAGYFFTEIGDEKRAHKHFAVINEYRDKLPEDVQLVFDAFWDETSGRLQAAWDKFQNLKEKMEGEKDYFLHLAKLAVKMGKGPEKAMAILKEGIKRFPDDVSLRKTFAQLERELEGDAVVNRYAAEATEKKTDPVSSEVASELVVSNITDNYLVEIPKLVPTVRVPESTTPGNGYVKVGKLTFKLDDLKEGIDFTCDVTMDHLGTLATVAIKEGRLEIATELANLIEEKGQAVNSKDVFHMIQADIHLLDGDYDEALNHAVQMNKNDPMRFLTIGTIKMRLGQHEEAAQTMEKAFKLGVPINPIAYYEIAKAYLLAGNYKKWDEYNGKFLKETSKKKPIPKSESDPNQN